MTGTAGRLVLPVSGGLCLAAATPPAWFPGAELLVLVGLAVWFVLASPGRPLWHSYVLGCVHMAAFSWSVRHVLFLAWVFIAVVGGLYYVAAAAAVRQVWPRWRVLAFAFAVAAVCWLRAVMPEIGYPHGQPCHVLWQWPALLGSVVVGGEALANALLAAFAGVIVGIAASWRVAVPPWPRAWRALAVVAAAAIGFTVLGHSLLRRMAPAPGPTTVEVAAIEPGFHPMHDVMSVPEPQWPARANELFTSRLLTPTREVLTGAPPDVVLWPESSVMENVPTEQIATGRVRLLAGLLPASSARLVLGANVVADGPPTPAALVLELPSGRVLAHQEKRHLVPGGERQPFLSWLPEGIATALRDAFTAALGSLPEATPGRELPPLVDRNGVPFGALLCYDNAYPGPGSAQVAMGARWLCVLSNEAWYEGGDELAQLMAMTVVRALEVGTPILRCTQDGWTGLVDGAGRLVDALPLRPAWPPGAGSARILRVAVPLGPGRLPPMAWLRAAAGPAAALCLGLLLLHGLWRCARLRAARTTSQGHAGSGCDRAPHGSGA